MIKNARFIRLLTQGVLALILLLGPVSSPARATISDPKIQTEWVSIRQLKSVFANPHKYNRGEVFTSHNYQYNTFASAGKLKSDQTEWRKPHPRTLLQKTIPFGTNDELIA